MVLAIDIGLLLICILSLLSGWKNGIFESLFSLAAWVGGILVAFHASRPLLERMPPSIQAIPGAPILAAVAAFLVAFLLIRVTGHAIGSSAQAGPGGTDRFLGVAFGAVRGILLAAAIGSLLVAYLPREARVIRESRALPFLAPAGRLIGSLAPDELRQRILDGWNVCTGWRQTRDGESIRT